MNRNVLANFCNFKINTFIETLLHLISLLFCSFSIFMTGYFKICLKFDFKKQMRKLNDYHILDFLQTVIRKLKQT